MIRGDLSSIMLDELDETERAGADSRYRLQIGDSHVRILNLDAILHVLAHRSLHAPCNPLLSAAKRKRKSRGGISFLLSPLSCGLFRPTFRIPQKYCQQKKASLVLPFVLPLSWRITQKYQVDQKFIVKKSWER